MDPFYHIADTKTWNEAKQSGEYRCESLESEGFIHCSTPEQIIGVTERRFIGRKDLVLLKLDPGSIPSKIIFENTSGGTSKFPHIYGTIPVSAVKHVYPFQPEEDGHFKLPF